MKKRNKPRNFAAEARRRKRAQQTMSSLARRQRVFEKEIKNIEKQAGQKLTETQKEFFARVGTEKHIVNKFLAKLKPIEHKGVKWWDTTGGDKAYTRRFQDCANEAEKLIGELGEYRSYPIIKDVVAEAEKLLHDATDVIAYDEIKQNTITEINNIIYYIESAKTYYERALNEETEELIEYNEYLEIYTILDGLTVTLRRLHALTYKNRIPNR